MSGYFLKRKILRARMFTCAQSIGSKSNRVRRESLASKTFFICHKICSKRWEMVYGYARGEKTSKTISNIN